MKKMYFEMQNEEFDSLDCNLMIWEELEMQKLPICSFPNILSYEQKFIFV